MERESLFSQNAVHFRLCSQSQLTNLRLNCQKQIIVFYFIERHPRVATKVYFNTTNHGSR